MDFNFKSDGTITRIDNDNIYQGSINFTKLSINGTFDPSATITANFRLPNEEVRTGYSAVYKNTFEGVNYWGCDLSGDLLTYAGQLYMSLTVLDTSGVSLQSGEVVLTVLPSVLETLPVDMPEDVYNIIRTNITDLYNNKMPYIDADNLPTYVDYATDGLKTNGVYKNFSTVQDTTTFSGNLFSYQVVDGSDITQYEFLFVGDDIYTRTLTYISEVLTVGDFTTKVIPTKVSDLDNDSNFIDNTVTDLVNYTTTTDLNNSLDLKANIATTEQVKYIQTTQVNILANTVASILDVGGQGNTELNIAGDYIYNNISAYGTINLGVDSSNRLGVLLKEKGTVNYTVLYEVAKNIPNTGGADETLQFNFELATRNYNDTTDTVDIILNGTTFISDSAGTIGSTTRRGISSITTGVDTTKTYEIEVRYLMLEDNIANSAKIDFAKIISKGE